MILELIECRLFEFYRIVVKCFVGLNSFVIEMSKF